MGDPYHLKRFIDAQQGVYANVLQELSQGQKLSHWMWFIFPQIAGLGSSPMARQYAISSLAEARAYLADPVLGHRLLECTRLVNSQQDRTLEQIFGGIDALKFRSCISLFSRADSEEEMFKQALDKYCGGKADLLTIQQLKNLADD